jgi:hypothetical protein
MIRRASITLSFALAGLTQLAALPMATAGQVEAAHGPNRGAEEFGGSWLERSNAAPDGGSTCSCDGVHAHTAVAPPLPVLESANA